MIGGACLRSDGEKIVEKATATIMPEAGADGSWHEELEKRRVQHICTRFHSSAEIGEVIALANWRQ